MNQPATLREQVIMMADKVNPGRWEARLDYDEPWPEDRKWTVESEYGFTLDICCSQLTDKIGDVIIDYGEFPYTTGFTEAQAKAIAEIMNSKQENV